MLKNILAAFHSILPVSCIPVHADRQTPPRYRFMASRASGMFSWLLLLLLIFIHSFAVSESVSAFRRESTFLSVVPVFPLWGFVWEGLCGRNGKERLCRRILKTSAFWVFCLLPLYVSQILQETELLRASCFPVWSRAQSIRNCLPYPGSIPWSMKKTRRESKKISFGTGKMLDYIGKVCYNYKWAYFSVCTK